MRTRPSTIDDVGVAIKKLMSCTDCLRSPSGKCFGHLSLKEFNTMLENKQKESSHE